MRSSNHDRTSGFRGGGNNLQPSGYISNNSGGGYRGNRGGGYNNRGGGMNATSSYNRGYQQPMTGGFQGPPMSGFQGMGGAQSFGGFQNRGGMMGSMRGGSVGMRGGRGGMNGNGMMAMPMGGMGMGNMGTQMGGLGMGMPQMAAGMGMQGMQSFQNPLTATGPGQYPYTSTSIAPTTYDVFFNGSPDMSASWANRSGYTQFPASGNTYDSPPYRVNASSIAAVPSSVQQSSALTRIATISGQGGFQGNQAHYNPAFFSPQQPGQSGVVTGVADASWNPHGAKRTRQGE